MLFFLLLPHQEEYLTPSPRSPVALGWGPAALPASHCESLVLPAPLPLTPVHWELLGVRCKSVALSLQYLTQGLTFGRCLETFLIRLPCFLRILSCYDVPTIYLNHQEYLPSSFHVLRAAQCHKLHVNETGTTHLCPFTPLAYPCMPPPYSLPPPDPSCSSGPLPEVYLLQEAPPTHPRPACLSSPSPPLYLPFSNHIQPRMDS